jgi:hypothetical protein
MARPSSAPTDCRIVVTEANQYLLLQRLQERAERSARVDGYTPASTSHAPVGDVRHTVPSHRVNELW